MLKFNLRQRWRTWTEQGADVAVLISPLTATRRAELIANATEHPLDPANPKRKLPPRVNQKKFQDLVADECVHGWRGIMCDDGEGTPLRPLPYDQPTARALMDQDLFSLFVLSEAQSMGLEAAAAETAAGKDSGSAPNG